MSIINFINVGGPYKKIIDSFINPIIKYLPEAIVTTDAVPDAVNVTFFVETYLHHTAGTMVFIPHGIADKKYRDIEKVSRFDYICVSGPAWITKMISQGVPEQKLFVNGYTKLDPLFQGLDKRTITEKRRVLWAPTHTSTPGLSSYPLLKDFFARVSDNFVITTSPHPANSNDKMPTLDKLRDADIVVADSGSTVYEAWALGKQVIFPRWLIDLNRIASSTFEREIFTSNLGFHAKSEKELETMISTVPLTLSQEVKTFINGIFPPALRGSSGQATAAILKTIKESYYGK